MVKVVVNNQELDIVSPEITLVKQVNDVGDISNQNSSYTWAFEVPKTYHNTNILGGLGLKGNNSNKPYELLSCSIQDGEGAYIISNGVMQVISTDVDSYSVTVKEGIVSFQKLIEGKKLSTDIPMDIRRARTVQNIIDSWSNQDHVKFLVGNYGRYPNTDARNYVPWLQVKYIFDRIFETFGWFYTMDVPDFEDLYLTFANPLEGEPEPNEYDTAISFWFGNSTGQQFTPIPQVNSNIFSLSITPIAGNPVVSVGPTTGGTGFEVEEVGNFSIHVDINAGSGVVYEIPAGTVPGIYPVKFGFKIAFKVDGRAVETVQYVDVDQAENFDVFVGALSEDQIVHIEVVPFTVSELLSIYGNSPVTDAGDGNINPLMEDGRIDVEGKYAEEKGAGRIEAFGDLTVKEFIKEILIRFGMVAFVDAQEKNIDFVNGKNRFDIEKNTIKNLPSGFAGRIREEYLFGQYGRLNWLKWKHDDENDTFGDFAFRVENENLNAEETFYESKFSNPGRQYFYDWQRTKIGFTFPDKPIIPFFDKEIEYDEDTEETSITYTQKANTFYLAYALINPTSIIEIDGQTGTNSLMPLFSGLMFDDLFPEYYSEFLKHVNKVKVHTVEMAVSGLEVAGINLRDVYYSPDELCFYIINKITYRHGKISTFEMLKLKH